MSTILLKLLYILHYSIPEFILEAFEYLLVMTIDYLIKTFYIIRHRNKLLVRNVTRKHIKIKQNSIAVYYTPNANL